MKIALRAHLILINIVMSAFLLFQIQPILAKQLLPLWGGGAAIWTSCMLFFQGALLLGYLHAFGLSLIKNLNVQLLIQTILLLLSLILLPHLFWEWNDKPVSSFPEVSIVTILLIHIGLPFFILSSTGVILQHWYAYLSSDSKQPPYGWYAWSNIGSLIALLGYPFIVENHFTLLMQKQLWAGLYCVFVMSNITLMSIFYRNARHISQPRIAILKNITSRKRPVTLWIALSAAGCMMLLSTTHSLTLNISSLPFLWVLPLSLYLMSYILVFSKYKLYTRQRWIPMFVFCLFAALLMFFVGSQFNTICQIIMYVLILFVACVVCHGELFKSAPSSEHLTLFYLCISLGGFIGSLLISFVAPLVFQNLAEYPASVYFIYILLGASLLAKQPLKFKPVIPLTWAIGLLLIPVLFVQLDQAYTRYDIANTRNFYGYLSVKDVQIDNTISRRLIDGTTIHGIQIMQDSNKETTGYYDADTGIAVAIKHAQKQQQMTMAVIGLGAGVLASYGRSADTIHFYELNPDVKYLAETYFDYLSQSPAKIDITLGDGRISMQNYPRKDIDLLVIDAFSSDSIPVHLLTQEAISLYWQRMTKDGLLVIHISNNHLDLYPIIASIAKHMGKQSYLFKSTSTKTGQYQSEWVVMTNNQQFNASSEVARKAVKMHISTQQEIVWTDQFNSLLPLIKF